MRLGSNIAAAAFEAVAGTFGETVRIEPMVSSEYIEAAPDPDRATALSRSVVSFTPTTDGLDGRRSGSNMQGVTQVAHRAATLWITPADYAAIGYDLRSGDRVVLVERPGTPGYRVARAPVWSDRGDVTVYLIV